MYLLLAAEALVEAAETTVAEVEAERVEFYPLPAYGCPLERRP